MPTLTNRWAVLGLLFVIRLAFPVQYQAVAPLVPFMIDGLGINYTQIGLLIGAFMLPGVVLALPGGLLGKRFGDKRVIIAGVLLMLFGTELLAFSQSFPLAFTARLISGAGAVLVNVQIAKVITDWFAGRELSTAMGFHLGTFPLGVGLSVSTLGAIAEASSWRVAVHVTGIMSVLSLVLLIALYRDRQPESSPAPEASSSAWKLSRQELVLILLLAIVWILFNVGYMVFVGFTPTLLIAKGHSVVQAGFLVGVASWVGVVAIPAGGWLADRTGRLDMLITVGVLGSAAGIALVVWGGPILLWMVLVGIALSLPCGAAMALPGQVLRPENRSAGFGIFYTFVFLGFGVLPAVAGWLHDLTGSADAAVYFSAALTALAWPALILFRVMQRRMMPV